MEIATQHSKAVSQGTGKGGEEGLFLNWITLYPSHITPGNQQFSIAIESHPAHSEVAVWDRTTMSAGKATQPISVQLLVEFTFPNSGLKNVLQG